MKLQVKKNAAASGNYLPDNIRTGSGKELQTDLEPADLVDQGVEQIEGAISTVDVKGNDQFVFCSNHINSE